jgi:HAD superfamily hydrolase (TIGR01490 family)
MRERKGEGMKAAIAFFDVDHTIIRGSTGRRFAEAAARRRILRLRQLAAIPGSYLAYRLGSGLSLFESEYPFIRGVERSLLEEIGHDVFRARTRKAVKPEMLNLIASIKADGGAVVLATSSFDFIVRPLGEFLGADALLASELEFEAGRCTGKMSGTALFGAAKRDAVAAFARGRGVELSDCSFYSDSIHDLPLLLEVGEPVAVDPDHRLRREARARDWEILDL